MARNGNGRNGAHYETLNQDRGSAGSQRKTSQSGQGHSGRSDTAESPASHQDPAQWSERREDAES